MGFEVLSSTGAIRTSPASPDTYLTTSAVGTQNNYNPGIIQNTFDEWNGASDITITGLAGGVRGYYYTFHNVTSVTPGVGKVAYFAYQSGSSSATNRLDNPLTSANTPVGPNGSITYFYDGSLWHVVNHHQGQPVAYTPVWTNGTLGNGTITGSYTITGVTADYTIALTWGNTTSSSGDWNFSLPVPAFTGGVFQPGIFIGTDAGVGNYLAVGFGSTSVIQPYIFASPLATSWGTTQPFVWGNLDSLKFSSTYLSY